MSSTGDWWKVELGLLGYGPPQPVRAVCATANRRALPALSTWYLTTNLPVKTVPLAEMVRLYGLRNWNEQSDQQMKDELGWADFMVRSDRAIRRHWALVCVCLCWWHEAQARPPLRGRWPRLLHAVRAWLAPVRWCQQCWPACAAQPPSLAVAGLLEFLQAGCGLNLYLSPVSTNHR